MAATVAAAVVVTVAVSVYLSILKPPKRVCADRCGDRSFSRR
jgi:hypothetical protein